METWSGFACPWQLFIDLIEESRRLLIHHGTSDDAGKRSVYLHWCDQHGAIFATVQDVHWDDPTSDTRAGLFLSGDHRPQVFDPAALTPWNIQLPRDPSQVNPNTCPFPTLPRSQCLKMLRVLMAGTIISAADYHLATCVVT